MAGHLIATVVAAAVVMAVCPPAGRLAVRALRAAAAVPLIALAEVVERRRAQRVPLAPTRPAVSPSRPAPQPGPGHTWRVSLYLAHRGRAARLTSGVVTGPWTAAADVEAETLRRFIDAHGLPSTGTLCARAQPVLTHGRAA